MSLKHLVVIGNKKVLKNKQASNRPTNRLSKDPAKESGWDRWLRAGSLEALRGQWTLNGGYWEDKGPESGGLEMLVALTEQKGRKKKIVTSGLLHPHQSKVTLARLVSILPPFWGSTKFRVGLSLT